jgi:hypothetical protein
MRPAGVLSEVEAAMAPDDGGDDLGRQFPEGRLVHRGCR